MPRFALITLGVLAAGLVAGCPYVEVPSTLEARFETSAGDFVVELDETNAPITVANFVQYANDGFYEGTIFHRVLDNFIIQGGAYTEDLEAKQPGDPIRNESSNGLSNLRGTIGMARGSDPDSATSQFYINVTDNTELDAEAGQAGYAVFGEVTSGMDVVDAIAAAEIEAQDDFDDLPAEAIVVLSVEIVEITGNGLVLTAEGEDYVNSVEYRTTVVARNLLVQIVAHLLP